jgi:hypothetical protein
MKTGMVLLFGLICNAAAAAHQGSDSSPPAARRAVSAKTLVWGDYDGDGRKDIYALNASGEDRLLRNRGDGTFEDVTASAGLAGHMHTKQALFVDFDRDHHWDLLLVGSKSGTRLFRNAGNGTFDDVTSNAGLLHTGDDCEAEWLDYDGDDYLDLVLKSSAGDLIYHNLRSGAFAQIELGLTLGPGSGANQPPVELRSLTGAETSDLNQEREIGIEIRPSASAPSTRRVGAASLSGLPSGAGAPPTSSQGIASGISPLPGSGWTDDGSVVRLTTSTDNVGIGTTTPAAKLEVVGTARMSDTLTLNPSVDKALDVSTGSIYKGGALFLHTKGGAGNSAVGQEALANVASGSKNTATGFQALFSNTSGFSNTANGYQALFSNTSGSGNTASGRFALFSNTTGPGNTASGHEALKSNTTGYNNTASGHRALYSNTVGSNNTATGFRALYSNTTGSSNTAAGYRALFANTTGVRNTASGFQALSSNTTGSNNTATEYNALKSNTTGTYNTATGYRALSSNTIGLRNTASGYKALSSNTAGSSNTASGYQALLFNSIGSLNTASGVGTLRSNTTGSNNTASGYKALYSNKTGHNNTASGFGALFSNTTGSRNIALGRYGGRYLTTGDDNIAIGNSGVPGESSTMRIGTAGTQQRAFIAGIRGVTTANADAIPVLVDSAGQLGTVSSSRRFKKDIADMGELTERLLELRPVVFHYQQEQKVESGKVPLEYGLIAEEVSEIFPDLVVYDDQGKPFTVKYHLLSSMLLNEMKRLKSIHEHEMEELRSRLTALESRASVATVPVAISADSR